MPGKKDNYRYQFLAKKWTDRHREFQSKIFAKHEDSFKWFTDNSKQLVIGSLAGIYVVNIADFR